jgi:hypothetical protein
MRSAPSRTVGLAVIVAAVLASAACNDKPASCDGAPAGGYIRGQSDRYTPRLDRDRDGIACEGATT